MPRNHLRLRALARARRTEEHDSTFHLAPVKENGHTPDYQNGDATLSIYLDPALTGMGLGKTVLFAMLEWLRAFRPATRYLHAVIDPRNVASERSFSAAGFTPVGERWTCEIAS